jgi:hypothetical protein
VRSLNAFTSTPLPEAHPALLPRAPVLTAFHHRHHPARTVALAFTVFLALACSAAALRAQSRLPPLQDRVAAIGASPLRAEFTPGATFTLELWVFPTTAPTFDWMAGKAYGAPGVDPHQSFALLLPSTRRPEFNLGIRPGVGGSVQSPNPIPLRAWTHLAGVSDGTTLRLYVNGTLVASAPSPGIPAAPAGVPFSLGRAILADGGTNFYPFPGYARQVRLWSVARTATQIAASLGESLPTDRAGLVAAWPLDDEPGARTLRELTATGPALTTTGLSSARTSLVNAGPFYADTVSPRDNATSRALHQGVLLDFDADGDLDAVYAQLDYTQASGGTPSRLRAFRNTAGTFTDVTDAVLGTVTLVHPRHQLVGDFNGDGRPDVLFAGHGYDFPPFPGEQSRLLLSTPDGRLVEDPARLPSGMKFTHNIAVADIDRDGDLDIYLCNVATGPLGPRLYLNDGRGFFTENTSRLPADLQLPGREPFIASHFVDVNRDGWPDLVLGPLDRGQNELLLNDRTGVFVRDPRFTLPPKLVGPRAYTVNIESADFNGDGWPDLILSTDHWLNVPPDGIRNTVALQLLLNRGDGTFTDASADSGIVFTPREYWVEWMYPVDFSGDGRPDLVLHVSPVGGRTTRLLENLGTSPVTFRDVTELYDHAANATPVLPGDIDRDGRIDFLAVTPNSLTFSRNLKPLLPGRLANLSVRTPAGTGTGDATLIAGFALGGTASATATKPLLVRAVGPTLAAFGVENTLADPAITVAPLAASAPLATNDNWSGTATLKNAFASVGAFALTNDASRDAALLVSPPSGAYTATVSGGVGVALVEVYDTGPGLSPRLVNLSARTLARTGADALIAGFVIDGTLPKKILLRAAGPTLAAFGVGNTLADPVLTLRPLGTDNIVATNDDWAGTPALKAAFASVGAFVFAADSSRDAALMLELPPGAYTATVSGKQNTTGVALVEVYELP